MPAFAQQDHLLEDAPVRVPEEIHGLDDLGRLVEGVVVQENRAEHRALGLEVVRERTIGRGDINHRLDANEMDRLEKDPTGREGV